MPEGMSFTSIHDPNFMFSREYVCSTLLSWVNACEHTKGFNHKNIMPAVKDHSRHLYVLNDEIRIVGAVLMEDNAFIAKGISSPIIKLYIIDPTCRGLGYGRYLLLKAFKSLEKKPFVVADVTYGNDKSVNMLRKMASSFDRTTKALGIINAKSVIQPKDKFEPGGLVEYCFSQGDRDIFNAHHKGDLPVKQGGTGGAAGRGRPRKPKRGRQSQAQSQAAAKKRKVGK